MSLVGGLPSTTTVFVVPHPTRDALAIRSPQSDGDKLM
jgi:hypothetical protein